MRLRHWKTCSHRQATELESLRGDLKGFHSIRINAQWRIIFRWAGNSAHDVQIIDYH
jgi:proteic killer suppression protein